MNILVEGSSIIKSSVFTLTGFTNPSSNCQISFTCSSDFAAAPLGVSYSAISLSLNSTIHIHIIDLKVVTDPESVLGGYYPLTISFIPNIPLFTGNLILIKEVLLKDLSSDCASSITQKTFLSEITCSYSSNIVTITINSFTGGSTKLTGTEEISITINEVRYNTRMVSKAITVELQSVGGCSIASGTNTDSWKPSKPASFQSLRLTFHTDSSTIVSSIATLSISLMTTIEVTMPQLVIIQVLDISEEGALALECESLTVHDTSKTILKGHPRWTWRVTSEVPIYLLNFKLPATEKPFRIQVTTYETAVESSDGIIHQQITNYLNATRISAITPGIITIGNVKTVSEISEHTVTFSTPLAVSSSTKFRFILPQFYDATNSCTIPSCMLINSHTFNLNGLITSTITAGQPLSLKFTITNPPTIKPVTESFLIEGHEDDYASFDVTAYLNTNEYYLAGTLKDFQVTNTPKSAYDQALYEISFTTAHKVLAGSVIVLTFPNEVITNSATLKSVTISGVTIPSAVLSGLTIESVFENDMASQSQIKVQLEKVRNPIMIDNYPGFTVVTKSGGYTIDSAPNLIISVTNTGTLPSSCSISNKTNTAKAIYSFVFKSNDPLPNLAGYIKYLTMEVPETMQCDCATLTGTGITGATGENTIKMRVDYLSGATEFSLSIECLNPGTTQPRDFKFTLSFSDGTKESNSVASSVTIQTETGKWLSIPSKAVNTPTFPGYKTSTQLKISWSNSIPIHMVSITVPEATSSAPNLPCMPNAGTCSSSGNNIQITFTTPLNSFNLAVDGITSINPLTVNSVTAPFIIKTYTLVASNYYLVDQSDDAGYLIVSCDFPCKECTTPNHCTSCIDNIQNTVYYLVRASNRCALESDDVCGIGYFKNTTIKTCDQCDNSCYECEVHSTNCTSCKDQSKVIMDGECKNECDKGYYVPPGLHVCKKCKAPCASCDGSEVICTSCEEEYYAYESTCVKVCPDKTYNDSSIMKCKDCDKIKCNTCTEEPTHCTSCNGDDLLEIDTNKCVTSCNNGYYFSDNYYCRKCNVSCNTCSEKANNCLSCIDDLYLYKTICLTSCPDSTYSSGTTCHSCDPKCGNCIDPGTICTSCRGIKVLDGTSCEDNCGAGRFSLSGVCKNCDNLCKTCVNQASFCTSCISEESYAYNGGCYLNCPEGTIRGVREGTTVKVCLPCQTGCGICSFNSEGAEKCIKCSASFKLYKDTCVYVCPDGYMSNSDGDSCVTWSESQNKLKVGYAPFPFLIAAFIFMAVPIAGWARNPKSLLIGNIIIGWTLILFIAFIFQALLAISDKQNTIFGVTLFSVISIIILNLGFFIPHKNHILTDKGFKKWAKINLCVANTITILGYVISFQIRRFYYSRFAGFDFLFVHFENLKQLLNDLNYFSMGFILFSLLPICIVDIYGYLVLDWGGQLFIELIETFILSFLMIGMILYEAKYGPVFPENFFTDDGDNETAQLGISNQGKGDTTHQIMLSRVFTKLTKQKSTLGKDGRNSHSQTDLFAEGNETDQRNLQSFPCSPRTQQKAYDFFKEEPTEQIDNVLHESVEPTEGKIAKETLDSLIQTIPMGKIQELKKKLQVVPEEEPNILFDLDEDAALANPFKVNEKSPKVIPNKDGMSPHKLKEGSNKDSQDTLLTTNEKAGGYKRKIDDSAIELRIEPSKDIQSQPSACKTFFDGKKLPGIFDSSEGFKFSMVRLDKQSTDIDMSKEHIKGKEDTDTMNLLEKECNGTEEDKANSVVNIEQKEYDKKALIDSAKKLTEENEILNVENAPNNGIEEQKQLFHPIDETKLFEKSPNKLLDIATIFGNFDLDETNAILIRETMDGKLLDKDGRNVNKYGYLVDKDGNIINTNGEAVIKKEEFDIEMNKLSYNTNEFNEDKEDDMRGRSDNEDFFMADSPSKYDTINMPAATALNGWRKNTKNKELERIYSPRYVRRDMSRYINNLHKNRNTSRKRSKGSRREKIPFLAFESQVGNPELKSEGQGTVPLFVSEYRKVRLPRKKREGKLIGSKTVSTNNPLPSTSLPLQVESNYEAIKKRVNNTRFPKVDPDTFLE